MVMKITQLADQVRDTPLRDVLAHYGFDVKREGITLRAKTERHNIVVTGSRWFDNKTNVGGGGAIDLVMHFTTSASAFGASGQKAGSQPEAAYPKLLSASMSMP